MKKLQFIPHSARLTEGGGGFKSLVCNTQIGEVTIIEAPPLDVKLALQLFFQFRKKMLRHKVVKGYPLPSYRRAIDILYRFTTLLTRITAIVSFAAALTFWI